MKLRKLLSTFLSVAMISTLVSAFSVAHAADAPVLKATTGYEDGCITVTVDYSGFENFVTYSGSRKTNVKGISAMSFKVVTDNADLVYDGAETLLSGSSAGNDEAIFAYAATSTEAYVTKTEGETVKFYFIADENAVANFTITEPKIRVGEYISGVEQAPADYTDAVTCVGATYGSTVVEPTDTITVTNVISEKVGDAARENMMTWGLAAVCDVDGAPTAKTITFNITAKDDVNGENTKPFTYDLGVEDWSKIDASFVFGLNIKGVPAEGATITCGVADVTIQ